MADDSMSPRQSGQMLPTNAPGLDDGAFTCTCSAVRWLWVTTVDIFDICLQMGCFQCIHAADQALQEEAFGNATAEYVNLAALAPDTKEARLIACAIAGQKIIWGSLTLHMMSLCSLIVIFFAALRHYARVLSGI